MQLAKRKPILLIVTCGVLLSLIGSTTCGAGAAELLVGGATTSITPDKPVALSGQMRTRIARSVDNPVTATALALETRHGEKSLDRAIMVSCDLVAIRGTIQEDLRQRVRSKLPGFDVRKLFLTATHTHTAPVMVEDRYRITDKDVMRPSEYVEFLLGRLGEVVAAAWESRKPGGVSWALGHAVVGHNRRAVYADRTAKMYGSADRPDFRHFEGYEDHGVEILFFWDLEKNPTAVAINVACPSQEVESLSRVNADFWHDVRRRLHQRYGEDLLVLGWPGASGDQSPHLQYRKPAEERMRSLRGLSRTEEIARRISGAVDDVFELAKGDVRTDVTLVHHVEQIELPVRRVTEEEAQEARAMCEELSKKPELQRRMLWYQAVVDRYDEQQSNRHYPMELHTIRLGDVAIVTNPFELFLDYGIRIKARSKAVQTFVIQLTGASGGYLATERAVQGGGYSAVVESTRVGPEGGQVLVDRTVEAVNAMWK